MLTDQFFSSFVSLYISIIYYNTANEMHPPLRLTPSGNFHELLLYMNKNAFLTAILSGKTIK